MSQHTLGRFPPLTKQLSRCPGLAQPKFDTANTREEASHAERPKLAHAAQTTPLQLGIDPVAMSTLLALSRIELQT